MGDRRPLSKWILVGVTNVAKQRSIPLKIGTNTVGKKRRDAIRFNSNLLSRQHCRLEVTDETVSLYDQSTNGTYINTEMCRLEKKPLEMGDLIGFGTRTFNIDETDQNRYIYRLDQRNEYIAETIDLVTDSEDTDPNPDPDPASDDSRSHDSEVVELSLSDDDSDNPDNYNAAEQNVYYANHDKYSDHYNDSYEQYFNNTQYDHGEPKLKLSPETQETWRSTEPLVMLNGNNSSNDLPQNHFLFSGSNPAATQSDSFGFDLFAQQSSSHANSCEAPSSPPATTSAIESSVMKRLELLKQKKKEAAEAKLITAQPLRKRRQTLVDISYSTPPQHQASVSITISLQERATRLAEIGEKERVAREEAERLAAAKRVRVQPKVKQTHRSRSDKLAETMLNANRK